MTPEQYQRVVELYHTALELEPEARAAFLDRACSDDVELCHNVESLLSAHDNAHNYFASPAMAVATAVIGEETMPSYVGKSINHYRVLSLLGAGGMGEVYLAEDSRLGRKVALKLLPGEFTRDADRVRRFEKEARAASALNHPNIITIHEIGQVDTTNYIVTEFVDGETLRQRMSGKRLGIGTAFEVASQIASALAAAHAAGIVHRDIKPENIMVRPDGLVKVVDFGLVKLTEPDKALVETSAHDENKSLTEPGRVMGTPNYMSPEQARGVGVDARSDIFSLGAVFYEMIAGQLAFSGRTSTDVIISIVQQEPVPLQHLVAGVPRELDQIIAKMLCKEREQRYQTAAELLADLKGLKPQLERKAVSGRVKSATTAGTPPKTRPIWPWALAATAVLLLAVGWWWYARPTPEVSAKAETPVIAVLPFKNLSEKESDYFSDGLTDEVIHNLSIIEGLEVRSRTSSFTFKDKPYSLRDVGNRLNVNYVVDGSVLRSGGNLRINAQLVRVSDEKLLWTGKFPSELKDIFKIQDEISRAIVNQLRVKLGHGRRRYDTSVEAYDLYLRAGGQSRISVRSDVQVDDGIRLYEQVIVKDPSFAPAYAKLASLYAFRSAQFVVDDADDSVVKSETMAEKAIQLDPLLSEAHVARGWMRARKGQWSQAENSFLEAIRLNPSSSDAYTIYAYWMLTPVGRLEDAVKQLRSAARADPLSNEVNSTLGIVLISTGQYDQAATYLEKSRDDADTSGNSNIALARVRLGQARFAEAIHLLENRPERSTNPVIRGWLGNAYARSGRREEAEQMAAVSQFANEQALIFAGLGDKDRTFDALERMGSRGPQRVGRFLMYPEFSFLRADPRLAALRKKVGLP